MTLKKILFAPIIFCITILLLPTQSAFGQLGSISGRIFDIETVAPLTGANIIIETRDGEFVAGLTSDEDGEFKVLNIAQGRYVLVITSVGYQEYRKNIKIRDYPLDLTIRMEIEVFDFEGVEITSSAIQDSSEVEASVFRIVPKDVQLLAGGGGDLIRVLQTLPGVQTSSDFSNQLIVRGGSPDQNLIRIDDIEVFNPYRLSGMASMFNPSVVRSVELKTGGFSANYGDRLSSVLVVSTRDITRDKYFAGELDLNMNTGNLLLEGKTPFWNGGWMITGRKTYFSQFADKFAKQAGFNNDISYPNFWDVQAKAAFHPSAGHTVRLQGLFSRDNLDWLVKEDIGEQGTSGERDRLDGDDLTENALFGVTWLYTPNTVFRTKIFANWYRNSGKSDFAGSFFPSQGTTGSIGEVVEPVFGEPDQDIFFQYDQNFAFDKYAVGFETALEVGAHQLEIGGGFHLLKNNLSLNLEVNDFGELLLGALSGAPNWIGVIANDIDFERDFRRYSGYVQDKWALFNGKVFIQPGLRYDYYQISDAGYVSPRLNASISITDGVSFRLAWGQYLQSPGFEKLLDEGEVFNLARYENLEGLKPEKAFHYVAGLSTKFASVWGFKVEGYYKELSDLIVQKTAESTQLIGVHTGGARMDSDQYTFAEVSRTVLLPEPENGAAGTAYGLEFLLEKRLKNKSDEISGWVTYTYALSEREQTIGDDVLVIPYEYDRRHQLNIVLNYRFGAYQRWNIGLTARVGSGLPYTPAQGITPLVGKVVDPDDGEVTNVIFTDPNTNFVRFLPTFGGPSKVNSGRLPNYRRVDFRITYSNEWLDMPVTAYFDIVNLFATRNILYYKYIIEANRDIGSLARPVLLAEPVHMLPFVPSIGVNIKF